MSTLLSVKNLTKEYIVRSEFGGRRKSVIHALNDVSFDIEQGEILGLVGESGCGKSTLGKCVLRLIMPTSGSVLYKGENLLTKSKAEMKIFRKSAGMIFQNPYSCLNPRMTVFEILKEPLLVHGIRDKKTIDGKVAEICELTGVDKSSLNYYPHEFSGGQRQRISIASAVILNPEFIVADEPVSALDVSIRAQIINLLRDLKEELNLTILFISHDLSVIRHICDRTAVMYLGETVESAVNEELFNNPRHPYTKALLSSIPIISEKKPERILLSGDIPSPSNLPPGCTFSTRCPSVLPECKCIKPPCIKFTETHDARCHLYKDFVK